MFFKRPCKVCAEKDLRISDLHHQITMLSRLAIPSQAPGYLPLVTLEANRVLDGDHVSVEDEAPQAVSDEMSEVIAERNRLLGGDY